MVQHVKVGGHTDCRRGFGLPLTRPAASVCVCVCAFSKLLERLGILPHPLPRPRGPPTVDQPGGPRGRRPHCALGRQLQVRATLLLDRVWDEAALMGLGTKLHGPLGRTPCAMPRRRRPGPPTRAPGLCAALRPRPPPPCSGGHSLVTAARMGDAIKAVVANVSAEAAPLQGTTQQQALAAACSAPCRLRKPQLGAPSRPPLGALSCEDNYLVTAWFAIAAFLNTVLHRSIGPPPGAVPGAAQPLQFDRHGRPAAAAAAAGRINLRRAPAPAGAAARLRPAGRQVSDLLVCCGL